MTASPNARFSQTVRRIADRVKDKGIAQELVRAATDYDFDYTHSIDMVMGSMGTLSLWILSHLEGSEELKPLVEQYLAASLAWHEEDRRRSADRMPQWVPVVILGLTILIFFFEIGIFFLLAARGTS